MIKQIIARFSIASMMFVGLLVLNGSATPTNVCSMNTCDGESEYTRCSKSYWPHMAVVTCEGKQQKRVELFDECDQATACFAIGFSWVE